MLSKFLILSSTRVRFLLLALSACCLLSARTAACAREPTPDGNVDRALWFPVGEELEYSVHWGPLHVANSLASSEWVEHGGRRLIRITFETQSRGVLDKLYPVDDYIESLVDPATFRPVRFTKRLNEGRYHTDEATHFDWKTMQATWVREKKGERRQRTYPIEADTRDLVSFMYFMRSVPMAPGHKGSYRVMADEKIYDLVVEAPRLESVELERYGEVRSLVVQPKASFEGLFVHKGEARLWVSTDPRRILTQLSVKVPVAHVRIVLKEVRGPGNDAWIIRPTSETAKDSPS